MVVIAKASGRIAGAARKEAEVQLEPQDRKTDGLDEVEGEGEGEGDAAKVDVDNRAVYDAGDGGGVVAGNTNSLGRVEGDFSAIESGPLAASYAGTFAGGRYQVVTPKSDTVLSRAGTSDQPLGQFFSL